jgi:small subunit ribosomal protein S10e
MLVTKADRFEVYKFLFREGVMVGKKDFRKAKHDDVDVSNLVVLNLMKSLVSRDLVKCTFSW